MARISMLVRCMAALALLSGSPRALAKGAARDPEVKGVRQIVLGEKTVGKAIAIRTARNLLTTVELPEDMLGAPTCGDCTDGKNPDSDALFRVEPVAQGRYLAITPNTQASARGKPGEEPVTMVLVRLEHATLMRTIEFQKVSSGVVSLRLPEGDTTGGPFEITVPEGSGKRRSVTVGGSSSSAR